MVSVDAPPVAAAAEWRPPFTRLLGVVACLYIGFGAVIPVLPGVVTHDLAGGKLAVGAVFATSGATALLTRPFAGRAAQRLGSRRVVSTGVAAAAVLALGYLLGQQVGGAAGLGVVLGVRILMGAAEAAGFTGGSVLVVALAPHQRRGQLVGWYGLAMWSGWAVGPLLGDAINHAAGATAVWWFAAGMAVLGALIATTLPRNEAGSGAAPSRQLVPPSVVLPGVALALGAVGYAALQGFVVLHLAARGSSHGSLVLTAFGAAYVLTRLVGSRVPDQFGAARIAVCCGLGEAAGLVVVGAAGNLVVGLIGGAVAGAGFAILYPSLALLVLDATPEPDRGTAIGAYTSFWDLGLAVGGLATGAIARVDLSFVFFLAAAAALTTAALGMRAATSGTRSWSPA